MGICGSKETTQTHSTKTNRTTDPKGFSTKSGDETVTATGDSEVKQAQPKNPYISSIPTSSLANGAELSNDLQFPKNSPNHETINLDSNHSNNATQISTQLNNNIADTQLQSQKHSDKNKKTSKTTKNAKILLLGSGESGKSTILKQIKIIHQAGFNEREKMDYKPFVYQNICESARCIIQALKKYDLISAIVNISSTDMEFLSNYEGPLDTESDQPLNPQVADLVEQLISDPIVKELLTDSKYEFYILDSARYFFENLTRIRDPNYLPTETDILRTRKQTSGIFDTKFQMEDLDVHLYDVGGQRSERKKWIHCFDNVTAIIFCVALSEYDQNLLESSTKNRLEESLNLFESVVNSMWFRRTTVILCLNKIDIFIEKLPNSPLEKNFPDYVGGANVNKAVKYILWRFKQLNRADLNLIPYVTQATDTNNIKLAFAIIRQTILRNSLEDSGIIIS